MLTTIYKSFKEYIQQKMMSSLYYILSRKEEDIKESEFISPLD